MIPGRGGVSGFGQKAAREVRALTDGGEGGGLGPCKGMIHCAEGADGQY